MSSSSQQRRHRRTWLVVVLSACIAGTATWWFTRTPSGDPGARILGQILPAASALPGYGTSALPWTSSPSTTGPWLTKSEPHQTSCDGMAGTQGWSSVSVQGRFVFAGPRSTLFREVGARLSSLGWTVVPRVRSTDTEHMWTKRLAGGSRAHAMLTFTSGGDPPWTFVVTAPPISHAAHGC